MYDLEVLLSDIPETQDETLPKLGDKSRLSTSNVALSQQPSRVPLGATQPSSFVALDTGYRHVDSAQRSYVPVSALQSESSTARGKDMVKMSKKPENKSMVDGARKPGPSPLSRQDKPSAIDKVGKTDSRQLIQGRQDRQYTIKKEGKVDGRRPSQSARGTAENAEQKNLSPSVPTSSIHDKQKEHSKSASPTADSPRPETAVAASKRTTATKSEKPVDVSDNLVEQSVPVDNSMQRGPKSLPVSAVHRERKHIKLTRHSSKTKSGQKTGRFAVGNLESKSITTAAVPSKAAKINLRDLRKFSGMLDESQTIRQEEPGEPTLRASQSEVEKLLDTEVNENLVVGRHDESKDPQNRTEWAQRSSREALLERTSSVELSEDADGGWRDGVSTSIDLDESAAELSSRITNTMTSELLSHDVKFDPSIRKRLVELSPSSTGSDSQVGGSRLFKNSRLTEDGGTMASKRLPVITKDSEIFGGISLLVCLLFTLKRSYAIITPTNMCKH